jgi:hypothetical protein
MENYDVSVKVDYTTDDEYRKCLLDVFRLTEYTEQIVVHIDKVREEVGPLVPDLLKIADELGAGFPPDMTFLLLFNYEQFKNTHEVLVSRIVGKGNQTES